MTDDELMQEAYDALGRAFPLRKPQDSRKLAAWLLARQFVEKAREYLEAPYHQQPRPITCDGIKLGEEHGDPEICARYVFGGKYYLVTETTPDEVLVRREVESDGWT